MKELPILLVQEKEKHFDSTVYIISIYFNYLQSIKSHSTNSTPILHIDESINRLRNDNFLVYTLSDVYTAHITTEGFYYSKYVYPNQNQIIALMPI